MRPGMTVRPDRSTVSAPAGTLVVAAGPASAMRSRSMTMRPCSTGGPPPPSTMRTLSRTSARVCAVSAAATHAAIASPAQPVIHRRDGCMNSPGEALPELGAEDGAFGDRPVVSYRSPAPRCGAAHAKQGARRGEPAAAQPLREARMPVERVHDDRPAIRSAHRRAHERSRRLVVGRHYRTNLIEETPGTSEAIVCTGGGVNHMGVL